MSEKRSSGDRRKSQVPYDRRKRNRRLKTFYFVRQAYLSDTNFFQNVYFARYFEFLGEAREEFLKELLGSNLGEFVQMGIGISTVDASIKYKSEGRLFDRFRIELKIQKLRPIKIELGFQIINEANNEVNATADMTVCFTKGGRPIPVPDLIIEQFKRLNML